MFCGCELSFGDEPNVHTCPVCLAHPGVLPVVNEQAIRYALQIAAALECEVAPRSIFHRKQYFYPDNPKAYQISQYDIPLASGGRLGDVRITRVHLEEDAAKMIHVGESGRIHGSGSSLVDFNRGGTPLVEIVTEPDIRDAAQAREWAQLLRETVRQLGVSDVNMEEGSLRVDANVSVRPAGTEELGTKTELKNMNSFRFLQRGVEAELERQRELIADGEKVVQETLHFDPRTGALTPLRSKEEAHDYRYFPEPDLVPLAPSEEMLREAREALPELPAARAERYEGMGLDPDLAVYFAARPEEAEYFEEVAGELSGAEPRALSLFISRDYKAAIPPGSENLAPERTGEVFTLVAERKITAPSGVEILKALAAEDRDPAAIAEEKGFLLISDSGELEGIVERAIAANEAAAEQIRSGNGKAIGAIVGAVMKETKGRADGGEVTRLIREKLGV
jgi:aspartyl-tRNA(Asn)/glutamyl-tRNA(Gln) amidotransferase subunit B